MSALSRIVIGCVAGCLLVTPLACSTTSTETKVQITEGNEAALRGDYATAVIRYEKALKETPKSQAAKRNLGIVFVKVGQYKRARQLLSEALAGEPNDTEILYFLGEACRGTDDFNAAANYYQKSLRIDGKDLRVGKALAWTWSKLGKYERSLQIIEGYSKTLPNDLQIKLIVANNYNKLRKPQKTVELLASLEQSGFKIQSQDNVSAETEKALLLSAAADAWLALENWQKADRYYREVLKTRPFLSSALVGSARCDLKRQANNQAMQKLERAAKSDPMSADAHFLLGKIYEKIDTNKSTFYYKRFLLLSKDRIEFAAEVRETKTNLAQIEKSSSSKRR